MSKRDGAVFSETSMDGSLWCSTSSAGPWVETGMDMTFFFDDPSVYLVDVNGIYRLDTTALGVVRRPVP